MGLVFGGIIVIVVGIFLPWLSETITSGIITGSSTATGYDLNEGLISGGITIISAILSSLGSKEVIPQRSAGFLIIVASIAIIVISGSLILDPGGGVTRTGLMDIETSVSLRPGVFITAIGGIILLLGGLKTSFPSD